MEDDYKKMIEERERWRTKVFWLLLEIAFIFGIPAIIGVLIGNWITDQYGYGSEVKIMILVGTFILSWVIVIIRYKQVKKGLEDVEGRIIKAREEEEQKDVSKE